MPTTKLTAKQKMVLALMKSGQKTFSARSGDALVARGFATLLRYRRGAYAGRGEGWAQEGEYAITSTGRELLAANAKGGSR